MGVLLLALGVFCACNGAQTTVGERASRYLGELVRIDTSNPPGNETRVARWLERIAKEEDIPYELLGADPERLNFVARLRGTGKQRALLLMAHTDVVPADAARWSVPPFAGEVREGWLWGRGAIDDKALLAAHLAVMVELKRRAVKLERDIILLGEADEESGSTGIQWLRENAWSSIDAEFALTEGGFIAEMPSGRRIYHVQTCEKIPTRAILRAHGTSGHGSLPLRDNPVVTLSRAITRLAETEQPVRLNNITRRYFVALSKIEEYRWLAPLLPRLGRQQTAMMAAHAIGERDPQLEAQLRTSISPTMLQAGVRINVIPGTAEAHLDIRRLPDETAEEVMARLRRAIHDSTLEVLPAPGQTMPAAKPSSSDSRLYKRMEEVLLKASPGALVTPYMQAGATDGAFLRERGVDVYGVPLFLRESGRGRAHGDDERISIAAMEAGTELLYGIVLAAGR
ncbi:MAG TPA: M20/M25/M40 family metallo-hydrolase [Bryobacteraceae bacterium]|nr:M20/M25/M40 family metallo-hydrolase [Bryobacteraceae bacterium]